jgi:hypothetical protein
MIKGMLDLSPRCGIIMVKASVTGVQCSAFSVQEIEATSNGQDAVQVA